MLVVELKATVGRLKEDLAEHSSADMRVLKVHPRDVHDRKK